MPQRTVTVHTSLLFDPKKKEWAENVSLEVDLNRGSIAHLYKRKDEEPLVLRSGDIDLRGKVVMPGFVDSHTHIFLHAYRWVVNFYGRGPLRRCKSSCGAARTAHRRICA